MSLLFSFKKGAQLPLIELTLTSSVSYDLADASAVNFVYRPKGGTGRTVVALQVTDAPNKKVSLALESTDVDDLGTYECHVEVTIGGKLMMFPQTGFDSFKITDTLE